MNKGFWYSAVAFAAALSAGATSFVSAAPARHVISTGALGKGTVSLWEDGTQLGATISQAAIDSLPNDEVRVDLAGDSKPFKFVELDWHPHGHEPKGVYDVPHFDVHFYTIDKAERDAIAFAPPGAVPKPASQTVPAGYVSDGAVVPQMGMHFVSAMQPEFHGKPFMCSQIWGYNGQHFAFLEAMFSLKFVNANGSFAESIARPVVAPAGVALPSTMHVNRGSRGYDIVLGR